MNAKKFFVGGIAAGVVYFFLGYLFYGILFMDFFSKNAGTASGVAKSMDQMVWWALILGNLMTGFLLAFVFEKAKTRSFGSGLWMGAWVGLFTAASYDLVSFGTSNLMNIRGVVADIALFTIMSAVSGAILGWIMGMLEKK
ncbi:MAG: DUF1761 domain-containing protein [Bacteroidota bacterium]|nr:DUF1761 domain-containing protein [Bacteroidota bacterium]